MSKSGFSTLNRWLGRKNKEKSLANGKLSKSSTNLSVSSTNINETSQLEYNRITPLPAATTNAPFEQTFRITVLLPKDQLYVTRLGARIPLSKLLELVCDNKLLDADKYEFRNPVDSSQVYSCDLTIGAVGLSEIRLCHKSESYDNFNADEIIKLHRTSLIRESLSSSEFSSRNSKHTTKTTSPYSSSNSLNSMDSSGLNYSRTPVGGPPKLPPTIQPKMAAPPRKKRAAPRPPSQIAIPEKSALIMENDRGELNTPRQQESPLVLKDFSVSTPNLTSSTMLHSDINGNDYNGHHMEEYNGSSGTGSINSNGYTDDTVLYAQVQKKNALNLQELPEPSPRKKIVPIQQKKKTVAPPAPPPRNSMYMEEDTESLTSANATSTPSTPMDLKSPTEDFKEHLEILPKPMERQESKVESPGQDIPKPVPRITTTTLLNATDLETDLKRLETSTEIDNTKSTVNVSKVLLNRTPTPEPRSLSCEPSDMETSYETHIEHFKQESREDDCISKQADSGIGEPVPSPIPDSLPSEASTLDVKSNFESSSDDDDMVKVYNFKLGKTLVKPLNETKTLEELTLLNNGLEETDSEMGTSLTLTQNNTPNTLSETSSWNFAIPISPPPNFADNKFIENLETDSKPDTPITPKIKERPILNFENFKQDDTDRKTENKPTWEKSVLTPSTPLDNIVDELSNIIQEKGIETLIKKSENQTEIATAKPNTLTNFSINSITQNNVTKPKVVLNETRETTTATVLDTATANESKSLTHAFTATATQSSNNSKTATESKTLTQSATSTATHSSNLTATESKTFTHSVTSAATHSSNLTATENKTLTLSATSTANERKSQTLSSTTIENVNKAQTFSATAIANESKSPTNESKSLTHSSSLKANESKSLTYTSSTTAIESNLAALSSPGSSPSSTPDEEKLYRKRNSVTSLKQRRSITRSDSFHTTAVASESLDMGLNKRTSSQLSLDQINGNLNRRRSSSELSIGETPSLQSLEIMKTILNTRKNSLNNNSGDEEKTIEVNARRPSEELKFASLELKSINKENIKRDTEEKEKKTEKELKAQLENKTEYQTQLREEKPKELPKVYRYSGPPSINFSTWNERPKVQIQAIKNEGDYIIGGKSETTKTVPRNYRMSTPITINENYEEKMSLKSATTPPPVAPKPATIQRMGIPEKDFKVPVLVKPIKDVIIENTPTPKEEILENKPETFATKPIMNGDIKPSSPLRPTVEQVLRPQTQILQNTATLPRSNKQRFSMAAAPVSAAPLPGPQLLRSSSITKHDVNKTPTPESANVAAPFGQNTLRRTGLKEKILAKEEQEKQKAINTPTQQTAFKTSSLNLTNGELNVSNQKFETTQQNSITSAKLHLNLKKSTSVIPNSYSIKTASPLTPTSNGNPTLKPKPQTPKTAPVLGSTASELSLAPPPPPLGSIQLKPVTAVRAPLPANNPRDQLMAAIRSFRVDDLKKD